MKKNIFIFAILPILIQLNLVSEPVKMIVNVAVADLRAEPKPVPSGLQGPALSKDIGSQISQISFCDCILGEALSNNPEWMKVLVLGQKIWSNNEWIFCLGYVLKTSLTEVSRFPKYNIVLQNTWTPIFSNMNDEKSKIMDLPIGTKLEAEKVNDAWLKVIVDGKIFGYIKTDGIYVLLDNVEESEEILREQLVKIAKIFHELNNPYVWGGRSPLNKDFNAYITGTDCSSLMQLIYLAYGFEIPRNSGSQFKAVSELNSGKDLKKADLIFLSSNEKDSKISHVIIYIGDGKAIECTGMGVSSVAQAKEKGFSVDSLGTRIIDVKEMIGVDVKDLESGKTITKKGKRVFLGSFLSSKETIQKMRDIALGKKIGW